MFLPIKAKIGIGVASGVVALGGLVAAMTITGQNGDRQSCEDYGLYYDEEIHQCTADIFSENSYEKLIFVLGNTANTPVPSIDGLDSIKSDITNVVANKGTIKYLSVANGKMFAGDSFQTKKDINMAKLKKQITKAQKNVSTHLTTPATTSGAAYYEAIAKAADEIKSSDRSGKIVVIGSGLSDSGVLNFAKDNLLTTETNAIVEALKRSGYETRDWDGVEIEWINIGEVVEPQVGLSDVEMRKVEEIYQEALELRGAEVSFVKNNTENLENKNTNTVKPTRTENGTIIITLSEDKIKFVAGKTDFADSSAAGKVLAEAAKNLSGNTKITVTGYVASEKCDGGEPKNPELAEKRAEKVKNLLIEKGVDASRITAINGGSEPGEECTNGKFDNAKMSLKRKVVIKME